MLLFGSASRLRKLVLPVFTTPAGSDNRCFDRNTESTEHVDQLTDSAMHRVDVNRFFVATEHSSIVTDSLRSYSDEQAPSDEDATAAACSYVYLDVVRVALAVVDIFVVLHRCVCIGCYSCCLRCDDGETVLDLVARPNDGELTRNGAIAGSASLCSKHDATGQNRKHVPNGSVSRSLTSFDVQNVDEDVGDAPDWICPLRRGRCRRQDASTNVTQRHRVGKSVLRGRWTYEQRRRRRQLVALLTRLVLCSIVVALVYIVVRSLDIILAELLAVAARQTGVGHSLFTKKFLSKTTAYQVYCPISIT